MIKEKKANDKPTESKVNYKTRIRRHRMAGVYRVLMVITALAILIAIVYVQYRNHIYTDYEYVTEKYINQVPGTRSMQLGDCILTYSNDGAHCTDMDGVEVWNQTFEMQNQIVSSNEDVVAIGDSNGNEVYVMNTKQKICQINTTMPIRNIAVAATGRVAVAMTDAEVTWIYIYDGDGKEAFRMRTTMSQSGFPVDFSFSPNGELLAASYIFVDAGIVKSQVAFYNFGSVGSNKTDWMVNASTYPDVIIPHIHYINNNMAVAVGDDRMLFYSGDQIPTLKAQHLFTDEIQGVYQGDDYVGMLFKSDMPDMRNKLVVYGSDSEKLGTYYFNTTFQEIFFTKDYFAAYGDSECVIRTYDDIEKFTGSFDKSVELLLPVGKGTSYKFAMISDGTLSTIQLK